MMRHFFTKTRLTNAIANDIFRFYLDAAREIEMTGIGTECYHSYLKLVVVALFH